MSENDPRTGCFPNSPALVRLRPSGLGRLVVPAAILAAMLLGTSVAAGASDDAAYPLHDGEAVQDYAERVGLPAVRTVQLADGVNFEFVLVPAGRFMMGAPDEPELDETPLELQGKLLISLAFFCGACLVAILVFAVIRSRREKVSLKPSLRALAIAGLVACIVLLSGVGLYGTREPAGGRPSSEVLPVRLFCVGCLLITLVFTVVCLWRAGLRLQFSLRRLVVMSLVAGAMLLSALGWHGTQEQMASNLGRIGAEQNRLKWTKPDERPRHEVVLSKPFYLGRCEVTQAQYVAVMARNPSTFQWLDRPVETVTWNDAAEFCRRLSSATGQTVRLPTEAEWEYACRSGTDTLFCSGDTEEALSGVAWYAMNSAILGRQQTHPAGAKAPNAWGLFDMHGNVTEWCQDWKGPYPPGRRVDPKGPETGEYKVSRGGAWNGLFPELRSTDRMNKLQPDCLINTFGFRIVMECVELGGDGMGR